MRKLSLVPKAEKDLEDIYDYTYLNWGLKQAEKYQDELYASMGKIALNPNIGSRYLHKVGDYMKLKVNRHLIFYRYTANECIVIRLLHQRMDMENILGTQ